MGNFLFRKMNTDEEYARQFADANAAIDAGKPLTNFQADTLGILAYYGNDEAKSYILSAFKMYAEMKDNGIQLPATAKRPKARISHLYRYFYLNIRGFKNPNHKYDYRSSKKAILEGIVRR